MPSSVPLARLVVFLTMCLAAAVVNRRAFGQTGACCIGTQCVERTFSACTADGGVWQTFGTPCTRDLCATPRPCCTGAFCSLRTPSECGSAGGTILIGRTSCSPNPCSGSCCSGGTCSITSASACTSGGLWTQFGTCSPNPCLGPCCTEGACTVTVQPLCAGAWTPGAACSPNPCPAPTCEFGVTANMGGNTTAVARVGASGLLVARGATLELYDLSDPNFPAPFSPPRRIVLPDRAVKIAVSPGASRAFVLLENSDIFYVTVLTSPQLLFADSDLIDGAGVNDVVSDGDRVFIPRTLNALHGYDSDVFIYERNAATGAPQFLGRFEPFLQDFKIDRLAKVGDTLWLGMHAFSTSTYAIEGWDVSNPAGPVRHGVIAGFADLNGETEVTGLQAIGNRLLLSFDNFPIGPVNRLRAADVTNPASPAWRQTVDLGGQVRCMSSTGNHLRLAVGNVIQTWDTTDPSNLMLLGTLPEAPFAPEQISSGSANDYIAVGKDGLQSATFANPSAPQVWSTVGAFPAGAGMVRQSGNTTVVYDYEFERLRVFDYTLAESQQALGTIQLSVPFADRLELTRIDNGARLLACVGSSVGGQIAVVEVTNPSLPILRATLPNAGAWRVSCTNARLYVLSGASEFKVFDLTNPASPAPLSTTPFGGNRISYTCMTSWQTGSTHAVALGGEFGLWLINATNGAAPQVSAVYSPGANMVVRALAKGPTFLYVSSAAFPDSRLESLNVASLTNPVATYVTGPELGAGEPGAFGSLAYVSAPSGRFLVGSYSNFLSVALMDLNGPLGDGVIHRIFTDAIPSFIEGLAQSASGDRVLFAAGSGGLQEMLLPQAWAPGFSAPAPSTREVCLGGSVSLTARASARPAMITYRWFREGNPAVALTDGPTPWGSVIAGATGPTLTITGLRAREDRTFYSCEATNSCGPERSGSVRLVMCIADFDCSGAVTVPDIFAFLSAFFAGSTLADLDGAGGVSVQDIFVYLSAFFAGCP